MTAPVAPAVLAQGFPVANYFIIGGTRSPGKATLTDAARDYGWQINKGWGLTGATVTPSGDEVATIKFLIEIWDAGDVPLWDDFAQRFLSKSLVKVTGGVKPMALGILHPSLNRPPLNITKVVVKQCNPLLNDGAGLWTTTVTFLEYRAPLPALSRPNAAMPPVAEVKPTAVDAADREIEGLRAELHGLGTAKAVSTTGAP